MRYMLVVSFISGVCLANPDPKFVKVKEQSEALGSLGTFVDKYIGDCGPAVLGGGECAKNAEAFRKEVGGKKFYMIVTEDSTAVLQLGEVNPRDNSFILNLTPLFAASNSAVSHGAPTHTDAQGNPVLPFIRISGTMPDGWNPGMLARQVQARAMRLQIVFTPLGLWTLPKKGGGTIKGVKARFDAVLVEVGRSGEHIGLWQAK